MYFYELMCCDEYEGSSTSMYYSETKLKDNEFSKICKDIFDKHATKGTDCSWIEGDVVDWDMELRKYGLKPVKAEETFIANYTFE